MDNDRRRKHRYQPLPALNDASNLELSNDLPRLLPGERELTLHVKCLVAPKAVMERRRQSCWLDITQQVRDPCVAARQRQHLREEDGSCRGPKSGCRERDRIGIKVVDQYPSHLGYGID